MGTKLYVTFNTLQLCSNIRWGVYQITHLFQKNIIKIQLVFLIFMGCYFRFLFYFFINHFILFVIIITVSVRKIVSILCCCDNLRSNHLIFKKKTLNIYYLYLFFPFDCLFFLPSCFHSYSVEYVYIIFIKTEVR